MACQALTRKRYNDPGWECDGTGLVTVLRTGGMPIVCPEDRVDELTTLYPAVWMVEEFSGGDHYHVILPKADPA